MRPKRPNRALVGTLLKGVTPSEGFTWTPLLRLERGVEVEGMRLRICVRRAASVDEGSGTGAMMYRS